jgi:hypothetical protein
MGGGTKITRRRRNLMEADPHCFWCGREVREYPGEDKAVHPDRATIDHLYQKSEYKPRPAKGFTVLSCEPCNYLRAQEAERLMQQWEQVCQECAGPSRSRFCSGGCFRRNKERLGIRILAPELHRMEKERERRRLRNRLKRQRYWRNRRLREEMTQEGMTAEAPAG